MDSINYGWRKLILFCFIVLLPAIVVGISNFFVFPDSSLSATLMLIVTVGVAAVFTWQSGNATSKIRRYCIIADIVICVILCANLGSHWLLAREVSAARQGVEERHAEENREDERKSADTERQLALKKAEADLQNAETRRLGRLPRSERRSALSAPKVEPKPTLQPMTLVPSGAKGALHIKPTPDQVRESWWWLLTALAFAECFASVLAGAVLAGIWEWDRNHDGIADHLQLPKA